ncbi:Response regulator receiver modulated diguanylate cyclase [Candidatus Sulfopaludibacter sp. SbA4]|nr:Response regulator receiver modulated diguanylate cyclase [Candidatus Sulfopaludibacter sp. SbA4]
MSPDITEPRPRTALGPGPQSSGRPKRVLAAEDNPVFQSMLRTMLTKWGYEAVMARDGVEAWQILQAPDSPRLAILDWMMPGMDGVEVCRRVRAADREPYIYILLLTARTESQDIVEGMDAGADDYLTKPFNAHELRVRLRAGSRILDLQEELLVAREALREQATHDSLTGLLNRASILQALQNELSRADRESQPVSLLMVDLDRFKNINDTHGHLAGDAVLREAARRMKSAIRRYDAIGRYGGEEFLILLPGCEGETARLQAERVRESLAASPFTSGADSVSVTCSIGASWRGRPGISDTDSLVRDADLALYCAKDRGRNRVEMAAAQPPAAGDADLPSLALAVDRH